MLKKIINKILNSPNVEEKNNFNNEIYDKSLDEKIVYYCPCCGFKLNYIDSKNNNFKFIIDDIINYGVDYLICKNENCYHSNVPLILFSSTDGINTPASDNWAIGFVK